MMNMFEDGGKISYQAAKERETTNMEKRQVKKDNG